MRAYAGDSFGVSALILPIREIEATVQPYRRRYTTDGAMGLLPHITILYPFAAQSEWDSGIRAALQTILNGFPSFTFQLVRLNRFPTHRTLFLEPEPNQTILDLTRSVAAAFPHYPPYGGAIPIHDLHPHSTVAIASTDEELVTIEETCGREIAGSLRVTITANEVWFVVKTDKRWERHTVITLGRERRDNSLQSTRELSD